MQNTEKNYVVYVTDFGADPTGQTDSAEAVIRAMEQAKKIRREDPEGRITLDFPRGTYQFYPDMFPIRWGPIRSTSIKK